MSYEMNEFFACSRLIVAFVLFHSPTSPPNSDTCGMVERNACRHATKKTPIRTLQAKELSVSRPGVFRCCTFYMPPTRCQEHGGRRDNDSCRRGAQLWIRYWSDRTNNMGTDYQSA